jgi:hypothetical protein
MTAGEIYLYRHELARHRALAILIGDYDRKLDNYIITSEGHFVPIDAGQGDVTGERITKQFAEANKPHKADLTFTIEGRGGRDHWYNRVLINAPGSEILTYEKTLFRKFLMGEEAMTFQGAEPVVIAIENYFVKGTKAAEAERLIGDAYKKMYVEKAIRRQAELKGSNLADPAVRAAIEQEVVNNPAIQGQIRAATAKVNEHLKARAPRIRDAMKGLNKRNGIPLYEMDVGFSAPLHLDRDIIIAFPRQNGLITICLARAA